MTTSQLIKNLNGRIYKLLSPKMHRSHYLKWNLDTEGDWSIRYFWTLDAHPQHIKQWVLKSHKDKTYIHVSRKEALEYIFHLADNKNPVEIQSVLTSKGYKRQQSQH